MSDDLNDWIEPYGEHPQAQTPNLSKFAENALVFNRAYCGSPLCLPSRTAFLSGLRASTSGSYGKVGGKDPENIRLVQDGRWSNIHTLPGFFKDVLGYRTGKAGKIFHQHDQHDPRSWNWGALDATRGVIPPYPGATPLSLHGLRFPPNSWFAQRFGLMWGVSSHTKLEQTGDGRSATKIAGIIRDLSHTEHKDTPFFIGYGAGSPHLPWFYPESILEGFPPIEDIILPALNSADKNQIGRGKRLGSSVQDTHQYFEEHPETERIYKEAVRGYLASIKFSDACLGVVLDALNHSAYRDNTIVVIMGDHGHHLGEKWHWGKSTIWEESARTPMMIYDPTIMGRGNGRVSNKIVSLQDLYPTLVDLVGQSNKLPNHVEGRSFKSLLENPDNPNFKGWAITSGIKGKYHSFRTNKWTFIKYENGDNQLYDIVNDPGQNNDLGQNSSPEISNIKQKLLEDTNRILAGNEPIHFDIHGEYISLGEENPIEPEVRRLFIRNRYGDKVYNKRTDENEIDSFIQTLPNLVLPAGLYYYKVFNEGNTVVNQGSFVIKLNIADIQLAAKLNTPMNQSIAEYATNADEKMPLTFKIESGDDWLNLNSDGGLNGTPLIDGLHKFTVSVTDGVSVARAMLQIDVESSADNNVLINGDFSNPFNAGWHKIEVSPARARMKVVNGKLEVSLSHAGAKSFSVGLIQKKIELKSDVKYSLSFDARVQMARPIRVALRRGGQIVFDRTLMLDSQHLSYKLEGICPSSASLYELKFYVGGNDMPIIFDNIILSTSEDDTENEVVNWKFTSANDLHLGDLVVMKSWIEKGFDLTWFKDRSKSACEFSRDWGAELLVSAGDWTGGFWNKPYNIELWPDEYDRILQAGKLVYDNMKNGFDLYGLDLLFCVGDHEVGDNTGWKLNTTYARQVPAFKEAWGNAFTKDEHGNSIYTEKIGQAEARPMGTDYEDTSFAVIKHNVLFVSLDLHEWEGANIEKSNVYKPICVKADLDEPHAQWLESVLSEGNQHPDVDHIVVFAHYAIMPAITWWHSSCFYVYGREASPLNALLKKYNVDVYMSGEVHAHSVNMDPDSKVVYLSHGSHNELATWEVSGKELKIKLFEKNNVEYPENKKSWYEETGVMTISKVNGEKTVSGMGSMAPIDHRGLLWNWDFDANEMPDEFINRGQGSERYMSLWTHEVHEVFADIDRKKRVKKIVPYDISMTAGVIGNAVKFNGNPKSHLGAFRNYIEPKDTNNPGKANFSRTGVITYDRGLSLSAWVKTTMNGTGTIMSVNSGYFNSDNRVLALNTKNGNFAIGSSQLITTSSVINDGDWHHVAFAQERDTSTAEAKLYVDGQLVVKNVPVNFRGYNGTDFRSWECHIGNRFDLQAGLDGAVDDPGFWMGTLTPGMIKAMYNSVKKSNLKFNAAQMDDLFHLFRSKKAGRIGGKDWVYTRFENVSHNPGKIIENNNKFTVILGDNGECMKQK
ncbi:MAG: sulfatase-like hydrolase/transferase [Planctomycetes bacterium]|nr:sulfatase-like hydrolase/transferase [Planctomycetota bacterium]